jgi:hypothetical protein
MMEKEQPVIIEKYKKQVVPPEILAIFPGTYIEEEDDDDDK